MKVVYVSDLDGTLLNKNVEVNSSSSERLNKLIDKGINFTVSTGRGGSVPKILKDINFKLPIMLLNGAVNYDFLSNEYVDRKTIPVNKALEIIERIKKFKFKTFEIQTIVNNEIMRLAATKWNQKSDCLGFNMLNSKENMMKVSKELERINGINFFIHKRVYSEGEWYFDITPENVSKASRLQEFKEKYKFDKVIAFGDSENDLPLASVADEFYAVENAVEIVKKNSTGVIESCYENGVINFIEKNII